MRDFLMKQLLLLTVVALFFPACRGSGEKTAPDKVAPVQQMEGTESDFVELSEKEAGALADTRELKHRVVEREGEMLPATRDYRPDRLNFVIKGGKVAKVTRG